MKIDLNLLKELRDLTKAPLGDCKKVLLEANGNIKEAQELLKKRGILKAGKKGDRETNNGIVKFSLKGDSVVGVRILCETDFVAKNDLFLKLVDNILEEIYDIEGDFDNDCEDSYKKQIQNILDENVATIGESLRLDYMFKKSKGDGAYVYNHMGNTISSVVWYSGGSEEKAKNIALQVAAMNPTYISMDDIDVNLFNSKKEEFLKEMERSNKPKDIQEKIVSGKLYKFFQDDVLLEQLSIVDNSKTIKDYIGDMKIIDIKRVNIG